MIRREAAEELAREILGTFIAMNTVSDSALETASRIIMQAVEIDELRQQIEAPEAKE